MLTDRRDESTPADVRPSGAQPRHLGVWEGAHVERSPKSPRCTTMRTRPSYNCRMAVDVDTGPGFVPPAATRRKRGAPLRGSSA